MNPDFHHQTARLRLDERNHVEKPFLDQLAGLSWEIIDLDNKQNPGNTYRETFTEVVMLPVLREQLKVINDWLEDDQVEEVVKQLTAAFPGTGLIENNRHVLNLLLENTSISENRKRVKRALRCALSISSTGTITALSPSVSSRCAFWALSTTLFRTLYFS